MYGTNTATVSVSDNAQLKIFSYGFGIYCQNIAVDGGKLNINAKRGFGVRATKDITIKNAEANVKSEYSAIYAHQNLLIEKSVVNAESKQGQGITVLNNDLTVTDSVVKTVVSDEKSGMRVSEKAKFKNSRINTSFEEKTEKEMNDSVVFEENVGKVYGNHSIPADVKVGENMLLDIPENTSVKVTAGKTSTNNGNITLNGIFVNDGGTVICTRHSYGKATCIKRSFAEFAMPNTAKSMRIIIRGLST